MTANDSHPSSTRCCSELAALVLAIPPARRPAVMQCVAAFRPCHTIEESFAVGPLRAKFAKTWESLYRKPLPVEQLRAALEPPLPIGTVLCFSNLLLVADGPSIEATLEELIRHLFERVQELVGSPQLSLFDAAYNPPTRPPETLAVGHSVSALQQLIDSGRKYPTIYADPPWSYTNEASRAAAVNHYPKMSVDAICAEPVRDLAADNAHLHLWTTNGFLRESFAVIDAWGFTFKSCLVWVKDEIGMGNYWRVSHEFLLLGVRGSLTFRDRTLPSWIQAPRTIHSRKPAIVRTLVERVSPGPYLELYGREELPLSAWTVYGNQVERRLF
ncbi:MAG: MT-A70 family methyltransferase [Pirellulales bacterium]|nr:MT-A70 family methyltransferase [Pirellulales bacterium]